MIPLFSAKSMEPAVDLLAANFRNVLVVASFYNLTRIRMRADLLKEKRVWFQGTDRQVELWRERGGIFLTWNWKLEEGPHDACFIVECPRSIDIIDRMCQKTSAVGCVYIPPTWRLHEEVLEVRNKERSDKVRQRARDRLHRVREFVDRLPPLTTHRLASLLRARELSLSSCAPESREAEALPSGTNPSTPGI